MMEPKTILDTKPTYKSDKVIAWKVGHYTIKQILNKFGGRLSKYFLYDDDSDYYNVIAFATFTNPLYLTQYLELLAVKDAIQYESA